MRKRFGWLALALTLLAAPVTAQAQEYFVPPKDFVGPLSHIPYTSGGFYAGAEFLYMRQTRPLRDQTVAVRGFFDLDGALSGDPGTFVGSGREALNVEQLRGPGSWQPGNRIFVGYRFEGGVAVELDWWHLADSRYRAFASLLPPGFPPEPGVRLEDTYLTSPVANLPYPFAGTLNLPPGTGNFGTTFGIYNAAAEMDIAFIQRFDMVQVNARVPIWQTDCYRTYGLFGPRAIVMWERFRWRTVDRDFSGQANPTTVAVYSNVVSNRLYGVHLGSGHDWYMGSSPIGAFSCELDLQGALYADFAKGRARYELEDRTLRLTRARNMFSAVPGVEGRLGLKWYPWEAIQIGLGYNFMALFNTWASPRPIDFNAGTIDPRYENVGRWIHGLDVGIAFVF